MMTSKIMLPHITKQQKKLNWIPCVFLKEFKPCSRRYKCLYTPGSLGLKNTQLRNTLAVTSPRMRRTWSYIPVGKLAHLSLKVSKPNQQTNCSLVPTSLNLQELMTMSNDSVKVYRIMKSELKKKKSNGCCARKRQK